MKTILHDLYFGNISPLEHRFPEDPELILVNLQIEEGREKLSQRMTEEDRKQLEELENLYASAALLENIEIFSLGFKLGTKMLLEVFREAPEPMRTAKNVK